MPKLDLATRRWLLLAIGPRRDEPPLHRLAKPLARARVALVTTGGFVPPGEEPFDTGRRGDPTYRVVPHGIDPGALEIHHPHYDPAAARADINVLFPYPLLDRLAAEGAIGEVAPRHYSFMGYIPVTAPLEETYAPQVAGMMQRDAVDAALLVPA